MDLNINAGAVNHSNIKECRTWYFTKLANDLIKGDSMRKDKNIIHYTTAFSWDVPVGLKFY